MPESLFKWIERIDEIVNELSREGKKELNYIELSVRLSISPNYARDLLRAYAYEKNFKYEKGVLIIE